MGDFTTVPVGTYLVRVREVRQGQTRQGDSRWSVALDIVDGEHRGRLGAWDALVWSARGTPRARQILAALGIPEPDKPVDPGHLVGRIARVEIRPVEFTVEGGETIRRNEVPYDGWEAV